MKANKSVANEPAMADNGRMQVETTLVQMIRDHGYDATEAVIEAAWDARKMNWPTYNQLKSQLQTAKRLASVTAL